MRSLDEGQRRELQRQAASMPWLRWSRRRRVTIASLQALVMFAGTAGLVWGLASAAPGDTGVLVGLGIGVATLALCVNVLLAVAPARFLRITVATNVPRAATFGAWFPGDLPPVYPNPTVHPSDHELSRRADDITQHDDQLRRGLAEIRTDKRRSQP